LRASLREKKEGGRCTGEAKVVVNSDGLPTSKRCSLVAFLRGKKGEDGEKMEEIL
jgi:hypothetical protein